ncbi:putative F-box protein PP2-B12 [Daucus carota subsp. sativus]|uniref:putative F-box protein PP2-B12 n=1 Tax=Daucus carota subsp. sativus TaxID=79200 RepID=UPI0007B1BE4F
MAGEGCEHIDLFEKLPQECIEEVVSRVGPMEVCRLSAVCKRFLSAAESDLVWDRFLPSDYQQLRDRADAFPNIKFAHKKDLFLFLIGNHVSMDGNTMCFWLSKRTGKKCFLTAISIVGDVEEVYFEDDGPYGWSRVKDERSRIQGCFTLCEHVELFGIQGKMSTSVLSPNTTYTIYLVCHSRKYVLINNFDEPVEVSIAIDGVESIKHIVYLDRRKMRSKGDNDLRYPQQRKDDRFEVELGEYFNKGGGEVSLEITMTEVRSGKFKSGPTMEGFEFRPIRSTNALS